MGLLEKCQEYFGTSNLYRVLAVRKEATEGEIRRGYHKVSLKVHPDRVTEDEKEEATQRFQILGKVYAVLSEEELRAVYDEQGIVDEEVETLSQERDWQEYWRLLFKKVTVGDIKEFEQRYKGSEEERVDVKQAYLDLKGDMDGIMESLMCTTFEDEPRIREILEKALDAQEIPAFQAFTKESTKKQKARKRRGEKEAKEAEEAKKELDLDDGDDSLKLLIQQKQKNRGKEMDNFLAAMEAKYCKNTQKSGKKTAKKRMK
ncbi:dnaJ homolog subfamily C member 9 [Callorhinchus milii]|uniref:DnaJ homolog subfamily C member 9 n=1 Tax=Callorhinchus milii TaxID=7868 RepID=A0A4W3I1P9_CALMI|nr:dnaJ homolog subfamily C member 9 [Callorhinchus milii]XP_007897364.1 dnaJ homolog subfamily C member 9 [Callorhinchus milii]XP_007897370.1 dnaJ homolog subfamily C member 9 [Callorhinchus milii]|eukprot:gi/632937118/ref/XP_007897354.1/ PREDICTED: dnaJ homolog subfamily C member 9 [Callorhinchus milii]